MATQVLQNQFFLALENSPSFALLTKLEQLALKNSFVNADDEQLQEALQAMQADQEANLKYQESEAKKALLAKDLKNTLKEVNQAEIQYNQAEDAKTSAKAADELINQLESVVVNNQPPKKKFWGLF